MFISINPFDAMIIPFRTKGNAIESLRRLKHSNIFHHRYFLGGEKVIRLGSKVKLTFYRVLELL